MFKIPDWDDDTPKSNANFAKINKKKKDKTVKESSANHNTRNSALNKKHDNFANTKKTEEIFNLDVNHSKNSSRKRKHDKIANTKKKKARFSDLATIDVIQNSPQKQKNDTIANKKVKVEEYLNLDILNAADEALVNESKKKLDDEIRNVDQEDLLFNEVNGTTLVMNKKDKRKKNKKCDTSLEKQNDFSFTDNIAQGSTKNSKKNQKENVNHPDLQTENAVKKSFQKNAIRNQKSKYLAASQINGLVKDSINQNGLLATKKVLKNQALSEVKKEKNKNTNITDTSVETETDSVLFEKKPLNNLKKEKIKAMLKTNRRAFPVTGIANALRERMLERLKVAQFRYLNEKLYTSSGSEAQQLFQSDPSAFHTYHQGYQQQVKKWPVKPLDIIVEKILKMPKSHVIADMGCGEAALSRRVPHSVRSFDLVGTAPGVEACDMARTPLAAGAVHACVYCLALMGTQLTEYLLEANRVLKPGGQLLIAEVESRFTDVDAFTRDVQRLGFKLTSLDKSHRVFFFLQFRKTGPPPVKKSKLPQLTLNPCLYKKR